MEPAKQIISDKNLLELLERGSKRYHCGQYIYNLNGIQRQLIYQDLEIERLRDKHMRVLKYYEIANKDWNTLLFIHLMHSISDPNNVSCYVEIAVRLGYSTIHKEKRSLENIEALLIAMTGMLPLFPRDNYTIELAKKGDALLKKYNLNPLTAKHWNRSNMTAAKHPIIRLSQVARIFQDIDKFFDSVTNCASRDDIIAMFSVEASTELCKYFDKKALRIGITRSDLLGINFIIPILMAYGFATSNDEVSDRANNLNESLPPEENQYTRKWRETGLTPTLSYETQALIQLAKIYCSARRCHECIIYKHMLSGDSILHKIPRFIENI